ncbi:hypothetical protein SPURM210S_07821 [Streptomyces purpurascens]
MTASSRSPAPVPCPSTVPGIPGSPEASSASVPEAGPPDRSAPIPGTGIPRAARRSAGPMPGTGPGSMSAPGTCRGADSRVRTASTSASRTASTALSGSAGGAATASEATGSYPAISRAPARRISACPGGMRFTPSYGVESCSAAGTSGAASSAARCPKSRLASMRSASGSAAVAYAVPPAQGVWNTGRAPARSPQTVSLLPTCTIAV